MRSKVYKKQGAWVAECSTCVARGYKPPKVATWAQAMKLANYHSKYVDQYLGSSK